ncbi:uncharacterized protein LOC116595369 [Mustela erminea]|uniref:uncharacterized protein LOC116595369 n=1 Tax=Mustela erminea TaxID=36723 RepID=UPI001386A45B|nr:uncharacterized protein LOC116595369 [Mustela erminea]
MLHTETGMRGPSLSTFAKDWGAGYSGPALERPLFTAMAPHSTWKLALFKEALSFLNIGFLCAHMSSWLCTCSPHPPNHTHWRLRPQCPSSLPSTETPVLLTCVLWQPLRAWAETCQCGQWPGPEGSQGTSLTRGQQRDNGDHSESGPSSHPALCGAAIWSDRHQPPALTGQQQMASTGHHLKAAESGTELSSCQQARAKKGHERASGGADLLQMSTCGNVDSIALC